VGYRTTDDVEQVAVEAHLSAFGGVSGTGSYPAPPHG
jgi:hypothetical protein